MTPPTTTQEQGAAVDRTARLAAGRNARQMQSRPAPPRPAAPVPPARVRGPSPADAQQDARAAARESAQVAAEIETDLEAEVARVRRDKAARLRQFEAWDQLTQTDKFQQYLSERGLVLREELPDMPYDAQAEDSVIGCMVRAETYGDMACVPLAVDALHPSMFYRRIHRLAFQAMVTLHRKRERGGIHAKRLVDITTVQTQMRRDYERAHDTDTRGRFSDREYRPDEVVLYLLELNNQCATSLNVGAYFEPIIETARRRMTWQLGDILKYLALRPSVEVEELLAGAQNVLFDIAGRGWADVRQLLDQHS